MACQGAKTKRSPDSLDSSYFKISRVLVSKRELGRGSKDSTFGTVKRFNRIGSTIGPVISLI